MYDDPERYFRRFAANLVRFFRRFNDNPERFSRRFARSGRWPIALASLLSF
jgi:hypothetical protein